MTWNVFSIDSRLVGAGIRRSENARLSSSISIVLDFSGLVLAEAVLSYINIGVDPSMESWGNMINQARLEMARDPAVWWSLTAAFTFMFTLVLFANLFADVVRDALDPRVSGSD